MANNLVAANATSMRKRFCHTRPGLPNFGHNSFENASIQALFACEEFRIQILLISHENHDQNPPVNSIKYLSDYFTRMAMGTDQTIRIGPTVTLEKEVDPYAYLSALFDILGVEYSECEEQLFGHFPSDLFVLIRVMACKHRQLKYSDWFTTLKVMANRRGIRVSKCAQFYFDRMKKGVVGACRVCRTGVRVRRIHKPRIIIFEIEWMGEFMTTVKFEQTIELEGESYSFVACVCRELTGTEYEYFCCYAKVGRIWYRFKDESVKQLYESPMSPKQLETVYLLFYQKQPNIPKPIQEFVNSLIPAIESAPQSPYAIPPPDPPQYPVPARHPLLPQADLIDLSLGRITGLLQREEGICYMNTGLQALFHCEPFRLHILSGGHSGRFHTQLRQYFLAINAYFRQGLPQNFGQQLRTASDHFYESFCLFVHKEFATNEGSDSYLFIMTLLFELNDEIKSCVRIEKSHPFRQKPSKSMDAWRQLMVRQHNSYLFEMFAIQRVVLSNCQTGQHIRKDYYFSHELSDYLHLPHGYQYGKNMDIQMIVDNWSIRVMSGSNSLCGVCGQSMYWWSKITRSNNCLIFALENYVNHRNNNVKQTVIKINEFITVCSQFYFCKAIIMQIGCAGNAHTFVYCKVRNVWVQFDDQNVQTVPNTVNRMLPIECIIGKDNRYAEYVFYEKVGPSIRAYTHKEQQSLQTIKFNELKMPDNRVILMPNNERVHRKRKGGINEKKIKYR